MKVSRIFHQGRAQRPGPRWPAFVHAISTVAVVMAHGDFFRPWGTMAQEAHVFCDLDHTKTCATVKKALLVWLKLQRGI